MCEEPENKFIVTMNEDVNSNTDITDEYVYRNSHSKNAPAILQGKYFIIEKRDEKGKISAKCVMCKRMISGALYSTGNFLSHISRVHPTILHEVKKLSKRKYSYPEAVDNTAVQDKISTTGLTLPEKQTTDCPPAKKLKPDTKYSDKKYNEVASIRLEICELNRDIRKEQLRQEHIKTQLLELELKRAIEKK